MTDLGPFERLVPLDHGLTVVVTRRADHTPHASVVSSTTRPRRLMLIASTARSRVTARSTPRSPAWAISAAALVPGVRMRIAGIEPPYSAPTYVDASMTTATVGSIV